MKVVEAENIHEVISRVFGMDGQTRQVVRHLCNEEGKIGHYRPAAAA